MKNFLSPKVKNNEIEKFVKFIGLLDDEGLSMAYRAADLFILPSLGEGQPTCILEAMANSCPVVATRIEGVLDYYEDFAVLADPGDPESLSEKIIDVIENLNEYQHAGIRGRKLVEDSFSWEAVTELMVKVYEEVILDDGKANKENFVG